MRRPMRLLAVLWLNAALAAPQGGAAKTDPVTNEPVEAKPKDTSQLAAPVSAPASAKDAPPAPPKEAVKVDPKLLDEALNDYFTGHPRDAAPKLWRWLENTSPTDDNYAWAQYFLARSFIDLGLRHAGAWYLATVARERTNPQVLPKALETLQSLTDLPHDEVLIDEQVFGALDLGFLPDEVSGYAHYQQGLVDLKVGNERWANTHFAKLPEGSSEVSRAKYALLVMRLKTLRKDVPKEVIDDFFTLAKDEKLTRDARNDAMLAVARLRYELKDWDGALAAYDAVELPALDPGRATLYLEEAWTRYQLGQLHAAMGILTTLDAPSFRDEFLPDKYLLRALIYRDLCHYLPAKRAAKELTRRFADSLESVREREDLTLDARLLRAAASKGAPKRAKKFLDSLDLEAEQLGRFAGTFGDRLFAHVTRLYDLARAEAMRVWRLRLEEAVRDEADTLLRAAEQVRLMEYEVGLKLYERVKKGSQLTPRVEAPPLTPSQVAFHFKDEYWNDELRDYRFSLQSRCLEEAAP